MDSIKRILRIACAALAAALMAGCTAHVAAHALGFAISWLPLYAAAAAAAGVMQLGRRGTVWGFAAAILWIAAFGALLLSSRGQIIALVRDFAQSRGLTEAELAAHAAAGRSIALLISLLLGMFFAILMKSPSGVSSVLMVLLAVVICAFAGNEELPLLMALPGMIAGIAAFALSVTSEREGMPPALLIPAAVVAVLALLLVPGERTTWAPLENLATQLRSVLEDYVRFTEERMAFSINEKGYNHAEMIGDSVVAMLGGPADPSEDEVMQVETGKNLLLRGTIKRSYTGYSWVDDQAKARYLYYDFTHRGVRSEIFGADVGAGNSDYETVQGTVEMLEEGTSTLFVPSVLSEFGMELANAVYYNSAGEIFLTRDVAPGDSYSFETRLPADDAALVAAAKAVLEKPDKNYQAMLDSYTALPEGIDQQVYALAIELTQNEATPAEKALAIEEHLARNYRYTLEGGVPAAGQDFVSYFLLESKEGYCSYFASSMAVMCRIAGIPARYVEGYFIRAEEDGETIVTGKNAHAWVEVYLNGLGWTPFDPTARAYENQRGGADDDSDDGSGDGEDQETPYGNDDPITGDPSPSPSPDIGSGGENQPTPSPTPDPGDGNAEDAPTPTPDPNDNSQDNPDQNQDDGQDSSENPPPDQPDGSNSDDLPDADRDKPWLWILLILLVLLALAVLASLWVRRRLMLSDPLKMCVATKSGMMAALILYRGILNLLAQAGLVPLSGETPDDFAARAAQAIPNPAYEVFVAEVVRSRYSGKGLTRETLEAGRRAYVVFLNGMRRGERLRYHLRRMIHGIGDLENIP